jgi:hypothetical protein
MIAWAAVKSEQYSKEYPIMMKIDLITPPGKRIYTLVGSDKVELKKEQERLKIAAKNAKKYLAWKSKQDEEIRIQRRSILDSDSVLYKEYKDFVLDSKIVSEEDFWKSKAWKFNEKAANERAANKGKLSKLFSEVSKETDGQGKVKVKIDADFMHYTFIMYPAVKKVYETKVPLEMSESEFWMMYIRSSFYTKDKGCDVSNMEEDDIFTHIDDELNYANSKNKDFVALKNARKRINVDNEVDLTATVGDYYMKGNITLTEPDERPALHIKKHQKVIQKYNKHSQYFIESISSKSEKESEIYDANDSYQLNMDDNNSSNNSDKLRNEISCKELLVEPPKSVINLKLKERIVSTDSSQQDTADDEEEQIDYAFGKRQVSLGKTMMADGNVSRQDPTTCLLSTFPTEKRAAELLRKDKDSLFYSLETKKLLDETLELPEQFKQAYLCKLFY